ASSDQTISVGATENDRIPTSPSLLLLPSTRYSAVPASNSEEHSRVDAALFDVESLDKTGLGCDPFPDGSLKGKIAFIQRGDCTFQIKFANARAAGAVGAVVYNNVGNPARLSMSVDDTEPLPGLMISRVDGFTVKDAIASTPNAVYTLFFSLSLAIDPNEV